MERSISKRNGRVGERKCPEKQYRHPDRVGD